jgi:hypothetical protein
MDNIGPFFILFEEGAGFFSFILKGIYPRLGGRWVQKDGFVDTDMYGVEKP